VRTIYNWYDPRIFVACNYLRARQELGLAPEGRYLLYVGHFHHFRGYLLADAMRLLPHDIKLIVVHPDQDPALQAELGDRFVFAGYVPPERMRLYYSAADFQCFPTPYGAFGLVLVEGMACGCPPIVFDYPAMNEVVTPQTGYLVPEPTAPAYAACIERAFQDGPTKRRAAMERARCFEMDPQIDRVLALYRELIAGEKSPLSASGTLQVVDVNARGQTTRIAGAVPPSRPK
jgi:glycosyltransferase involved in cell wall biosynthesis